MSAVVVQLQKKQEAKFICSACGSDRSCNCNAPAVEKFAAMVEQRRQANRTYREKKRKQKQQTRDIALPADEALQDCADCDGPEQFWHRGLMVRAGDAIAAAAFSHWRREYGDYSKFEVTSELLTLAEQAAEAWAQLASHLRSIK